MDRVRKLAIVAAVLLQIAARVDFSALPWLPLPFTPAPMPSEGGLCVLIVDENEDYDTPAYAPFLPVLNSTALIDWLDANCAKVDGVPEWRHWDDDVEIVEESQKWRDALAIPRASLPWIVVSNGRTGYSGPLPQSEAATLELLKKYASN